MCILEIIVLRTKAAIEVASRSLPFYKQMKRNVEGRSSSSVSTAWRNVASNTNAILSTEETFGEMQFIEILK